MARSGLSFRLLCNLLSNLGQGIQPLRKLHLLGVSHQAASFMELFQGSSISMQILCQDDYVQCNRGRGPLPALDYRNVPTLTNEGKTK